MSEGAGRRSPTGMACRRAALRLAPGWSAALAVATGLFGLLQWRFGMETLLRTAPQLLVMNPLTALCLILAGTGIGLSLSARRGWASALALVIAVLALAKIADLVTGAVPIDRALLTAQLHFNVGASPRTLAPSTAAALLFSGVSLALAQSGRPAARLWSQLVAIWLVLLAAFVMVGYTFHLIHPVVGSNDLPMALPAAIGFGFAGIGLLSLTPETGLALLLQDDGPAGSVCRIVLPSVTVVALFTGVLRLWAQKLGYIGEHAGVALQVMSSVVVTSVVLVTTAMALFRSDQARKQRDRELRRSDRFNKLIASANPDCVTLIGQDNKVLFVNDALLKAHNLTSDAELIGQPCGHHYEPERRVTVTAALHKARKSGSARFTICEPQENGEVLWFDTLMSALSAGGEVLCVSRDITEKKRIEDQFQWQALHDHLTGLPNRAHFHTELERRVAVPGDCGFAVLMIDIDEFKLVNDTLGHDAGDALLSTIAQRISAAVRKEDFVARLAGDEFAVILYDVRSEAGVIAAAERIFDGLKEPWAHRGRLADCRVSVGASIAYKHGDSVAELLKSADIALYAAKAKGRGQLAIFRNGMKAHVQKRSRQLELARQALRHERIVPYYQPKIDLAANRLAGFEALLRWRHPGGAIQLPGTIEAAFQDMELAGEITERMLSHVLWDMRQWLDQGIEFGHVAINVTAADLRQPDFAAKLLNRLDTQSIPHRCLQVEVTETVFLGRGAEYVERTLHLLHNNGIRVALDDFGTGYASLSHLKQFPVDIVKIDRSFLQDFGRDPQSKAIIATVVGLGHSLNIEVVAEGVESEEQAHYLLSSGCAIGQGHLFGKAAPASRLPGVIRFWDGELRRVA